MTSSGFNISGQVEGIRSKPVFLEKAGFTSNNSEIVTQVKADEGKFNIHMDSNPGPGFFKLRIGRSAVYLVLNGTETNITLSGSYPKFNDNTVIISGSELSEKYSSVFKELKSRKISADKVKAIAKESDPILGSILLIKTFGVRADFLAIHENANKRLVEMYPDLYLTTEYSSIVNELKKSYAKQQSKEKIKVGMPAPEIAMPGVDGKIMKLSELKGKIILIDFWASWCGPCIRSFPELTKTYEKYKSKGVTIYSVSLDGIDARTAQKRYKTAEDLKKGKDGSKTRWIKAIEKHKLTWDYHVSDLDKWDCQAAASYGVRSIPRTFLVDREGNIAAINPRFNLEEAIEKVLAK